MDNKTADETVALPLAASPPAAPASENTTPKHGSRKSRKRTETDDISSIRVKPLFPNYQRHADLPHPLPGSHCPLFCCFYAEFDNIVGPKICYQSPHGFMEQHIEVSVERIEELLDQSFAELEQKSSSPRASHADPSTDNESSIFDACSEYIITGSELSGKIINVSTNNIHVLSRPTMIADERYERNSLLFCVGFILRRTEDSRPFRPVLNKWALALRDMEMECHYLSSPSERPLIQHHLERLLVSLNSAQCECNLVLNNANVLNLKLFRPPKIPATPVSEHSVPIFLRRDRQIHMYDWDLAINWVSLHIDGVTNARQISVRAEVDMEMVLSCLRVLLHHGVIALVDMFFFTNHYECTEETASLLRCDSKLLQAAAMFVCQQGREHPSPAELSASSVGRRRTDRSHKPSSPSLHNNSYPNRKSDNNDASCSAPQGSGTYESLESQASNMPDHVSDEYAEIKAALVELYCMCRRSVSIGDLWVGLLTNKPTLSGSAAGINWEHVFHTIDHRRFASFGVIHGLLRRVHRYPLILGAVVGENDDYEHLERMDCVTDAGGRNHLGRPRGDRRQWPQQDYEENILRRRIACMMDGEQFDDELVCSFNRPLSELLDLVGDQNVVVVLAPTIQ